MSKILIIWGSTREGRKGEIVANWVKKLVEQQSDIEFEFIDLKDWDLPFYNDPNLASSGNYSYDSTKKWSEKISEGDGYLIIAPEYNHAPPAVLKNALDLLFKEWNKKPVAFVSYGGSAGGARAVEQLREVAIELDMVPVREAVHLVRFFRSFDEEGNLKESDSFYNDLVIAMLEKLIWWTNGLKKLRENQTL